MKAHICGAPSRNVDETKEQRVKRLAIAKGIKEAKSNSKKHESEPIESKNANMLDSVLNDSRDLHWIR